MSLEALVQRAQAGDLGAFEELVQTTQGRILRLCLRLLGGSDLAQDVAQETYLSAYAHLERLDPQRSPLPWLTTVATRLCLNRLRSQQRGRCEELPEVFELPDSAWDNEPEHHWLRQEGQAQLHAALLQLPESARVAVVLFYMEEWSCRQIAEVLGWSESNVKVTLLRARERLRKWLCASG